MSRRCYFTGKRTRAGGSITRRGKAKYLGGVGRKVTGRTKRKFKPNIQKVRAVVDGKICRIRVSTKAIKLGLVTKPPKRTWRPEVESPSPAGAEAPVTAVAEPDAALEGSEGSGE